MLLGDLVREEDNLAINVPRCSARRLDERGLRAQVALLVCVKDANKADFGQVQTLAKKVDADQARRILRRAVREGSRPAQ